MDVITLDSNFNPDEIVNEYETMAWTERYYESGEFELTTYNIEDTMALMPIDSCISLADAKQVMVVDSHLIETDADGKDVLKVSGPSIDEYFNTRWIMSRNVSITPGTPPVEQVVGNGTIDAQIAVLMSNMVSTSSVLSGFVTPDYVDPNHTLNPFFRVTNEQPGFILPWRYISATRLGDAIRAMLSDNDATIYSDRTTKHLLNPPFNDPISAGQILFVVYKRTDRREGSGNTPVTFSTDAGDFKKVSYLRSVKNYRNVALFQYDITGNDFTSGAQATDINGTITPPIGGLTRRELYVDTVDFIRDTTLTKASAQYKAKQRAITEMAKYQKTLFITAECSDSLSARYGQDYRLGDYITFRGDYGFISGMQITEFTRIQDTTGEHAYPTLTEI